MLPRRLRHGRQSAHNDADPRPQEHASAPLDGSLGDPFGGGNGAVGVGGNGGTDCSLGGADGDHDCFVDLVNASLSGVMCDQSGSCPSGGTKLTAQERDDMAFYLASVSYPPARSRRIDDTLSTLGGNEVPIPNGDGTPSTVLGAAKTGFSRFFVNSGGLVGDPDTCADSTAGCHSLPLGTATNSSTLNGFDAATMRGLTDRFVQFSLAPNSSAEIMTQANSTTSITLQGVPLTLPALLAPLQYDPADGMRELTVLGVAFLLFNPVYAVLPPHIWQMAEEASNGHSGAFARQVALNTRTTAPGEVSTTETLVAALELADARGLVNLRATGVRNAGAGLAPAWLSYRTDGTYKNEQQTVSLTRAQLLSEAQPAPRS